LFYLIDLNFRQTQELGFDHSKDNVKGKAIKQISKAGAGRANIEGKELVGPASFRTAPFFREKRTKIWAGLHPESGGSSGSGHPCRKFQVPKKEGGGAIEENEFKTKSSKPSSKNK